MLHTLSNRNGTAIAVQHAIGRKLAEVRLTKADPEGVDRIVEFLTLRFEDGTRVHLRDAGQSCCESRYMTTDDDLASYEGATVVSIEEREAPAIAADLADDLHEVAFLVVTTDRGPITVATHNEHNGYYGGFALEAELQIL